MGSLKAEAIVRELPGSADVSTNGSRPWNVQVHDSQFYDRVLRQGTLGLGEAYMDGWRDCAALDHLDGLSGKGL